MPEWGKVPATEGGTGSSGAPRQEGEEGKVQVSACGTGSSGAPSQRVKSEEQEEPEGQRPAASGRHDVSLSATEDTGSQGPEGEEAVGSAQPIAVAPAEGPAQLQNEHGVVNSDVEAGLAQAGPVVDSDAATAGQERLGLASE